MSKKPLLESTAPEKHFLERYLEKISKYYEKRLPTLFHICYDPVGSHRYVRTAFGFLFGFFYGLLLYEFLIVDLQLAKRTSNILGASVIGTLSLGCASSLQIRCICSLTIPGFYGRAGRTVLRALALSYVISGPVVNLAVNSKESMRSIACTGQLVQNITMERFDLIFKPIYEALKGVNDTQREIQEVIKTVKDMIEPIKKEIEGEDELEELKAKSDRIDELQGDSKRSEDIQRETLKELKKTKTKGEYYEVKYRRKIRIRCEDQLSRGSENCRQMFQNTYNKCFKAVTWAAGWLLCWPMKLTFVCNIVEVMGGSRICDPKGKIPVGIGDGYVSLLESRDKLKKSMSNAKINFDVNSKKLQVGMNTASLVAKGVMRDFEVRKRIIEGIIALIKRCLSLVFIKLLFSASNYQYKYLRDIEYDNIYVTSYFRRIDARRRVRGSPTLLPLKKLERTKLVDPYNMHQNKSEKINICGQTAKILLEMMMVSTFVVLDKILYELLDAIRAHAQLEITQVGHHDLSLEVQGNGLVATLVRKLVRGFNVKRKLNSILSNKPCLPQPNPLGFYALFRIYGTYFGIWMMVFAHGYGHRLHHVIAGFYYRKREKRRVLHLYNETLRKRHGFLKFARARVIELARSHRLHPEGRPFLSLRLAKPSIFGWLSFFECARYRCVVCGDPEPRRGTKFRLCHDDDCIATYCPECWHDVGEVCPTCGEDTVHTDETDDGDDTYLHTEEEDLIAR